MMFRIVFWDVLLCKMIVDRRFRGAYCLHHEWQSFYTAVHPRRQFWTSYSPPWELEISHTMKWWNTHKISLAVLCAVAAQTGIWNKWMSTSRGYETSECQRHVGMKQVNVNVTCVWNKWMSTSRGYETSECQRHVGMKQVSVNVTWIWNKWMSTSRVYETSECQRHVGMHAVVSPNTSQGRDTARQAYSKWDEAYSYFVTRLKCTLNCQWIRFFSWK
jgi:hypothetical protein